LTSGVGKHTIVYSKGEATARGGSERVAGAVHYRMTDMETPDKPYRLPPEWRMNRVQRNQSLKVCSRVYETLEELAEDSYDPSLDAALQLVRDRLAEVLPFSPEDFGAEDY